VKLLFTSGTARGGTNIRTLMLNNHSAISMSRDPFIPLFRYFHDSVLKAAGLAQAAESTPSGLLDDYYFSDQKLAILRAVQSTDPDIAFEMAGWPALSEALRQRMTLTSVNLLPYLDSLPAPTFREVFLNAAWIVAAAQSRTGVEWAGFNDNWAIEFLPLVARLIPDARFMIHLRDPRAVVYSSEFAEPDPAKRPTIVSFARGLRKYQAFAVALAGHPHLKDRLLISRYEPFIDDSEREVRRMTDFLGVEFEPAMLDITRFRKPDGSQWPSGESIYRSTANIWRQDMPREMAELTEFVCDPDMRLSGYWPEVFDADRGLSPEAFEYARRNDRDCLGWRTDFAEIERTLGSEMYRKRLLASPVAPSAAEIDRCFLFPEVFNRIRSLQS
jgi:hypothetical protein